MDDSKNQDTITEKESNGHKFENDSGDPEKKIPDEESSKQDTELSKKIDNISMNGTPIISDAMRWRNKTISCDTIRSFEALRKSHIEAPQESDKEYWVTFEKLINFSRESNSKLQKFFWAKLQADTAYADSIRKLRLIVDTPQDVSSGGISGVSTSCNNAINALGELQQELSEKIMQFTNVVKRDVLGRPLDEMISTFETKSQAILTEGRVLDRRLHHTQKRVVEEFEKYDSLYREMELSRSVNKIPNSLGDLWLQEMWYCISVMALQQTRVEYVQGMASLFQQFKSLEILRTSVIQTVLETYLRKQKLIFAELAGSMGETISCTQRIDAERDILITIRKLPKNNTALSLSSNENETQLFQSLQPPLGSPLVMRSGYLKRQVTSSIFKSWKDTLCILTQDKFLHIFDIRDGTSKRSVHSTILEVANSGTRDNGGNDLAAIEGVGLKYSISLEASKINVGSGDLPAFEINELVVASGMLGIFRSESTKRHVLQCRNQGDLMNWVVAIRQFTC